MNDLWTTAALWLVRTTTVASLLILLALLLARFARQPARRQRLCELGLAAALLATLLSLAPAWMVVGLPLARQQTAAVAEPALLDLPWLAVEEAGLEMSQEFVIPRDSRQVASVPGPDMPGPNEPSWSLVAAAARAVLVLYGAGVLFFLIRWVAGALQLRRLLRSTETVPLQIRELLGARNGSPRLLVSRRLGVPISCGVWRPTVVLPAEFCKPDAQGKLPWVLAHELTHIERRDALSGVLFALGQAVFFHLPWFWMVRKQVRLCQEYVADASAVAERPAEDYAEFLLTFTEAKALPLGATGVSGPVSDLFRRVTMLLQNPLRIEKRCPRLWTCGLAGVLLALAALLGGIGLRAEASDTIIIIIPGQQAKQPSKDAPAQSGQARKGAGSVDVRDVVVKVLTLDDKGNVLNKGEAAKPLVVTVDPPRVRSWLSTVVDASKTSGEEFAHLQKVIDELDKIRQVSKERGIDTRELRELADRLRERLQTKPVQGGAKNKAKSEPNGTARIVVSDPTGTVRAWVGSRDAIVTQAQDSVRGWVQAQDPEKLLRWGVQMAGAQVDLKKLEKLLERLQTEPGKVGAEEIRKALEELRKAAPTTGWLPGPTDKLQWGTAVTRAEPGTKGRYGIRFHAPSGELRDYLGLPKDQGIVVSEVIPGTPAATAGLKAKDIILKLNDAAVPSNEDNAVKMFAGVKDGTSVDLTILRRGKEEVIKGLKPAASATRASVRLKTRYVRNVDAVPEKGGLLSIRSDGAKFTAQQREKNVSITVKGTIRDGRPGDLNITVAVDGKTAFHGSDPAAVPEAWRQRVNRLLDLVRMEPGERERR
jgi:beta-lactamase regulating signal transducer with metallopeptidase domain